MNNNILPISVLIPTMNRPESLERTLKKYMSAKFVPAQIVVVDQSVKKDVVQRLLKLIDFRNYYEAFDGKFTVHNTEDDQIKLSWQKDDKICTLNVNLENYKSIIEYIDKYGNLKIYDI